MIVFFNKSSFIFRENLKDNKTPEGENSPTIHENYNNIKWNEPTHLLLGHKSENPALIEVSVELKKQYGTVLYEYDKYPKSSVHKEFNSTINEGKPASLISRIPKLRALILAISI